MDYQFLTNGINLSRTIQEQKVSNEKAKINPNIQRHVTFRQIRPLNHNHRNLARPEQNFTYGKSQDQQVGSCNKFGEAQIKTKNGQNIFCQGIHAIRGKAQSSKNKNLQPQLDRARSLSRKKRKLRIFPKQYQNQTTPTSNQPIPTQKKEILQIRHQIQKLRQQVQSLSINQSKSTSRDFSESLYRNEVERTRRLSDLNEFNERLYEILARKLKEISISEYLAFQEASQNTEQFLDSISASPQKYQEQQAGSSSTQWPVQKANQPEKLKLQFLDIGQFQNQYLKAQNKFDSNSRDIKALNQKGQIEQIDSHLLIKKDLQFQSTKNNLKFQNQFKQTQFSQTKNQPDNHPYTFHKNHIPIITNQTLQNTTIPVAKKLLQTIPRFQNIKEVPSNVQKAPQNWINLPSPFYPDQKIKDKKGINDFNRQLQKKIIRKKAVSNFSHFNKSRKY